MRDNDSFRPMPEAVQPDPMLEEHPAGPGRIVATTLAAAVIVGLALYGMTRPTGQQEMATATSESGTAPAGGGAANSAGGQASPANAPAENPQPNPQQPTTTGQGAGGQPNTPPASGGSATSTVGPGAKPAPQAR
jgi:hypothetical protein